MDNEEFNKLCEELKAQGMNEEDILGTLLEMFKKGEIEVDDMEKLAGSLGYELTDEFLEENKPEMPLPLPEEPAEPAPEEGEDLTEEEVEDAQEVDKEDEEDDKEEARKLFNLD